jgi:arabinogalactan oligomer/maltooligosaccharide transport system permease protein
MPHPTTRLLLCLLPLAACGPDYSPNTYSSAAVQQAARVDGASPWQMFRLIKLPLLLISVSPLLIAAFAFSFNDFSTIFMLSGGGPGDPTSPIGAGATDILITVVYKLAFLPGQKDYGLASAFAVIIFAIVSIISLVLFRRTKSLEEIY